ncbi:DUF1854 domain-containing protein [Anaeromicropila herbilytica]|uniref:DUF1854 domain-containing protein n=1 Tax=Anaeromicropila herbilytica TaxID=2785025 RepID=A0A7R7ICE4_9FIRM|nr:DUF1854 domain-containing protein [Anaeromicropila herbilytica]BCN30648.1 hypothetical protein bsdtb5_19430 [Anaeromicropila herbilytica]
MEETYEVERLNMLHGSSLNFIKNDSGFLSLEFEKKKYEKVILTRLIPFYSKNTYISVSYEDEEKNFHEIGVIKDTKDLIKEQRKMIEDYLEFKYYMPKITKVHSIKDNNRGYIFVTVNTTSGEKTLAIRDWYSNFKMLNDKMLYVVDADGNKYYAPDIYELDRKSLQCIEMFV